VRDQVRRLIPDNDLTGATEAGGVYTLATATNSDAALDDYLRDANDNAYLAAALALDAQAAAIDADKVSGLGYSIDTTATISALTARAAWLRGQAQGGSVAAQSRSIIRTPVW